MEVNLDTREFLENSLEGDFDLKNTKEDRVAWRLLTVYRLRTLLMRQQNYMMHNLRKEVVSWK